jgi:hypothetical protein
MCLFEGLFTKELLFLHVSVLVRIYGFGWQVSRYRRCSLPESYPANHKELQRVWV